MSRIMGIKGYTTSTSILITLSILSLLLIPGNARMITNIVLDKAAVLAYGQVNKMNANLTNSIAPENIPLKRVHVGDIDIAYKMFGKGNLLLLIIGAGATMDAWDPTVLKQLSTNHTVTIFDNRGIGQTSTGTIKNFSISQYANDTAGLLDALAIQKADVLGYSLGSLIAQELILIHPDKVDKLAWGFLESLFHLPLESSSLPSNPL
jgi:alpha/beta hydrolase fold